MLVDFLSLKDVTALHGAEINEAVRIIADKFNASVGYIPFPEADAKIESGSTYFDSSKIEKLTGITEYQSVETLF